MRSTRLFLLALILMLAIGAYGCSDSESLPTPPTDGDQIDGDADGDADVDGDEEACICNTEDACCDGCNPINADGACDDGDKCTTNDVCSSEGVCAGSPKVCEAPDSCHEAGECDPDTGMCSGPAKEDGTACDDGDPCTVSDTCEGGTCTAGDAITCETDDVCLESQGSCDSEIGDCVFVAVRDGKACEAQAGVAGSGVCLDGACTGFDECDPRNYGQDANYPCNHDSECASGMCLAWGDDWNTFCSELCGEGDSCPTGMRCFKDDPAMGKICVPDDTDSILPGDGSLDIFDVCNKDADCVGGLCLQFGIDGAKFCTKDCEAGTRAGDNAICGDCGKCKDGGLDNGFPYEYYCSPEVGSETGDPCVSSLDCDTRLCYDGYCTMQCLDINGVSNCPDDFICQADAYETASLCIKADELETEFGGECLRDYECATGVCRDVAGKMMCVDECTNGSCADGTCIEYGQTDAIDTKLALWDAEGETAIASNDDGGQGAFSKIVRTFDTAGTYYIEVLGYGSGVTGDYTLTVTKTIADEPSEVDESESNGDRASAQAITIPVIVMGSLDADDHDFYSFEIADGETVEITFETGPQPVTLCVPSEIVGNQGYGEACEKDYECADGRECFSGMCTGRCEADGDCPNGICFEFLTDVSYCVADSQIGNTPVGGSCEYPFECVDECFGDSAMNQAYCSNECTDNSDCTDMNMGCFEGMCVKGFDGQFNPYGACRLDIDCQTGYCIDGLCSNPCETATDCIGSEDIVPEEFGICWPCETNADCNDGGANGPNMCVSADSVNYFCGTDCTGNPGVCPLGTACYQVGWFGESICAPVTLTCDGIAACNSDGVCVLPDGADGTPCSEVADCVSGICENGLCQPEGGCSVDADCGCDYLVCTGGYCATDAGTDTAEVEPNGTVAEAQAVDTFPATIVSSLTPVEGANDMDLYAVELGAGWGLDVIVNPFCGQSVDSFLSFMDENGDVIGDWANDDIYAQAGLYNSMLNGFKAETMRYVYVGITQSPELANPLNANYVVDINAYEIDANDTCEGALELTEGLHEGLSINESTDDYMASSCTNANTGGKDVAYTVEIPANTVATFELTSDFDGVLYLVEDCADMATTCVAGVNGTVDGGVETLTYANETETAVTLFLIVDGWNFSLDEDYNLLPYGTGYSLEYSREEIVVPANDTGSGAPFIMEDTAVEGNNYGANDDYDPGVEGCAGKALPGRDMVWGVYVPNQSFINVTETLGLGVDLYIVTDFNDLSTCVAYGNGSVTYVREDVTRDGRVGPNYYVILDAASDDIRGLFNLEFTFGEVGPCSGPCDPAAVENHCEEVLRAIDSALCYCDSVSKMWKKRDCAEWCMDQDENIIGGRCHLFTTGTAAGANCQCEFNCTEAVTASQCGGQGSYTNCTCSSEDPCGWAGDDVCDAYCMNEFEDYFDDTADCPVEDGDVDGDVDMEAEVTR